jgi:tetratricopeptide (TPR) repeat protein
MGKRNKKSEAGAPAGMPEKASRSLPHGWLLAALLAAAFTAYLPALRGPFLFDDRGLELFLQSPPPLSVLLHRGARLITNLSFLAEARLAGLNPQSFHVTNLVLHLLNGFLVHAILTALLQRRGPLGAAERFAAAAGAGLFLLHPIATESVAYISSRSELLCAFFAYLAFLLFLRSPAGQTMTWGRAIAVTLLLGLGAVSKEPAIALAGVFVVFDLLDGESVSLRPLLRRWKFYAPLLAAAAAIGFRLFRILSQEGSAGVSAKHAPLDYLLTQFQVIWRYFGLVLFPLGQNLDHLHPIVRAPGTFSVWLGLIALAALLAAAWRFRRQYPLALFGLLFTLILLTPTSSIVPIDDAMAERRLYLGFPGFAMIAAEFLRRLRPSIAVQAAAGAALVILAVLTWNRSALYQAAIPMWENSVAANPKNHRAWFHLGFAYYEQGRCADAARAYEKAAGLNPKPDHTLLADWALALECAGRIDWAEARLREALAIERHPHSMTLLGRVLAKKGDLEQAMEALNEALRINPSNANALAYRGNVYLLRQQPELALADYEAALRLQPDDPAALKGRQSALRALGRAR